MAAKMAARKRTTPPGYATTGLPSRKVVLAVLKDVNRIRQAEGWPPVRALLRQGAGGYIQSCPVARTIALGAPGYEVSAGPFHVLVQRKPDPYYRFMSRDHRVSKATEMFIERFDFNQYPGLRAPNA